MKPARLLAVLAAACLAFAAPAADAQKKVLRMAFRTAETGFDPQRIDDRYSVGICENLFEPLLTYDYLARPVKLVPLTAEAIPEPEEGGTRYTFRIKPGILYAEDAAFNGKKRELVAQDMEYALKRFRDPKNRSPYEWLFENKIVGLDEWAKKAKDTGNADYDAKVAGIEVRGKYPMWVGCEAPKHFVSAARRTRGAIYRPQLQNRSNRMVTRSERRKQRRLSAARPRQQKGAGV